jgi:uncharacterized RDD family membrane protein YckC
MLDFDVIETPENVTLRQPLAGIGSRFIAGVVDNVLIAVVCTALFVLMALAFAGGLFQSAGRGEWWALAILILMLFVVYWGYFVFFELWTNGQSPGKKRMSIRVVMEGGGAITFTNVAVRNLLRVVDGMAFYAVAGVCMFFSGKVQRLGDIAAGTVVVSEQVADYSAKADVRSSRQWEREASAEALRSTGLLPQEFRALANYWARREELTIEARARVLPQLVQPISRRLGHELPDQSHSTLETYVHSLLTAAESAEHQASEPGS